MKSLAPALCAMSLLPVLGQAGHAMPKNHYSRTDVIPGNKSTRRLAAIVFVDVVGYSTLMAADQARTHARWMRLLGEVVRPQIEQHGGTLIQVLGDGVLAEFLSALDAVECAIAVQSATPAMQPATDDAIRLRIAVNVGEVIAEDGGIYGDGVNLAARLQEHAAPGGIVLSETTYDLLRAVLGFQARELGPLRLKNIERPIRAYAIGPDAKRATATVPARPPEGTLPSIAILPLQNLGEGPSDDYFADGLVEDIIVSLAGLRDLLVISRSSTLPYRGLQPDPREIGRTLGVRYVLTGSVRRSAARLRVSIQLYDAQTGTSLWADRKDTTLDEVFDLQDQIVCGIVNGIAPQVRACELQKALRKKPENFTAFDYMLKGLYDLNSLERTRFMQAREFLECSMREDPGFAMPVAWAARWHSIHVGQGWSSDPDADTRQASVLAASAIQLDPQNALALAIYGHQRSYLFHECDSAQAYLNRALIAGPSIALAWALSSCTMSYIGQGDAALRQAEHALRLSPLDVQLCYYYTTLGLAYYGVGEYEHALKWTRLSAAECPTYSANLRYLVASLSALGMRDEARAAATRLMKLEPAFRLDHFERTRQPFRKLELVTAFIGHLRDAGLPA